MEKLSYNHSSKILALLGVLSLFSSLEVFGLDTKRFDAPPPERPSYLTFAKPTPLRFSISPLPVDRLKLILPPTPIARNAPNSVGHLDNNTTVVPPAGVLPTASLDANASTAPQSYPQIPSPFLPQIAPPDSLPLSDPFENLNSFDVDSTDELLRILESSDGGSPSSSTVPTAFVPPFTVATDGMRISTKATYRRVER